MITVQVKYKKDHVGQKDTDKLMRIAFRTKLEIVETPRLVNSMTLKAQDKTTLCDFVRRIKRSPLMERLEEVAIIHEKLL